MPSEPKLVCDCVAAVSDNRTVVLSEEEVAALHATRGVLDRQAWRAQREASVREFFGEAVLKTDWNHPGLAHDACAAVRAWQYGPVGLLLSGDSGTGKTRALAALVWNLHVERGNPVTMRHAQELFHEIAQQQVWGRSFVAGFVDALASSKLLVIDDLGQEATTRGMDDAVRQWFFRLLDLRHNRALPCLITTNHTARTLAASTRDVSADPLVRRLIGVAAPVRPAFPCARRGA